jgi:hypothetical protein
MKLTRSINSIRQHYDLWLILFQSGAGITDREKSILVEILVKRSELSKSGIKEPFLTKLLFDNDRRKEYCSALDISVYSLNNTLKSLKDKQVLSEEYKIQSSLIPEDILEISFKYDNK